MTIWAIADLHLAISVPDKKMDDFGPPWINYTEKILENWKAFIKDNDLVLLPGDICWAMKTEQAKQDLEWIHALPGTKVMIRGNHDYWWDSLSKVEKVLPSSMHVIQNTAFHWKDVGIAGARLWDNLLEYNFDNAINYVPNPKAKKLTDKEESSEESERIFQRELLRLEMSLKALKPNVKTKIVMTHYPPIGIDLKDSRVTHMLEKYQVNICVFGHVHNIKPEMAHFGEKNGIQYRLVAADFLQFRPLQIL